MTSSRSNKARPMATRTERRRAALERRREFTRRGVTANVAARRRRTRLRWGIAGGVVVLLAAGTAIFFATRDDGDGVPNLTLSGEEVDADGALGVTAPLDAYTVDYQVTSYTTDPTNPSPGSQQVRVSRPFSSEITITQGEGDAATTATYRSVLGRSESAQSGADPVGYVSAPVPALYDWRFDASLDDLVASGDFQLHERRRVAERDCQVYRTGSAVESLSITAATDTDYADVCIDASGLVLEEVVYQSGLPARHVLATTVTEETGGDIVVSTEPADTTTTLTEIDAATAPVDGYWAPSTVPEGYELTARYAYSVPGQAATETPTDPTDPAATTTVAPTPEPIVSYFDVYSSGQDFLIVSQGPTSQEQPIGGTSTDGTIDPLGAVTESSGADGSTITAHPTTPADWFVRVHGSVDIAGLRTIAATLAPITP